MIQNERSDESIQVVKVLAVHRHKIVIVRQFRRSMNEYTYELPGGRLENGEHPKAAALREMQEETGLECNRLTELGTFIDSERRVAAGLYFTNDIIAEGPQNLEPDERIEVRLVGIEEALSNVLHRRWRDPRLGVALILARSKGYLDKRG